MSETSESARTIPRGEVEKTRIGDSRPIRALDARRSFLPVGIERLGVVIDQSGLDVVQRFGDHKELEAHEQDAEYKLDSSRVDQIVVPILDLTAIGETPIRRPPEVIPAALLLVCTDGAANVIRVGDTSSHRSPVAAKFAQPTPEPVSVDRRGCRRPENCVVIGVRGVVPEPLANSAVGMVCRWVGFDGKQVVVSIAQDLLLHCVGRHGLVFQIGMEAQHADLLTEQAVAVPRRVLICEIAAASPSDTCPTFLLSHYEVIVDPRNRDGNRASCLKMGAGGA